jgi:hypothetical protein
MDPQTLNTLIQSGSFGVLVAALVWLAKVFIPGLIRDAREDLRAEREAHHAVMDRMACAIEQHTESLRDLVVRHDRLEEQVRNLTDRK